MLSTDTGLAGDNLESGAARTNKDRPPPSSSEETAQATVEGESSSLRISRPSVICSLESEDRTLTTTSRRVSYLPLINLQDSFCLPADQPVQTVDVFCWKNQQQLFPKTGELHRPFDNICRRGDCEASVNWERCNNKYYCTTGSCVNDQYCMWHPQFERVHWLPCCCISATSQGYRHVTNMRANQKSVYFYQSRRSEETLKGSEWHCKQLDGANSSLIDDRNSKKPRKDGDGSSISSSEDGCDSGGCNTMLFGQNVRKNKDTTQEDRKRTIHQPCLDKPRQREGGSIAFKQKGEERKSHPPPWPRGKKTIRQACHGEPRQTEGGSIAFKQEGEEANAHPPPWPRGKKTIRQACHGEPRQTEGGSIAFKQEGEEANAHPPPWPRGKKTIRQACLGEPLQAERRSIAFKQEGGNPSESPRQDENAAFKPKHEDDDGDEDNSSDIAIPSSFKEKSSICVSRTSRINSGPSSWNHTSKRNTITSTTNQGEATEGTVCPVCNKKLKRSYYLKSHMLIHTGDKPYKCAYCNKAFNQIGNRNAHQRIHTGEKPYACDYCGKRFIFNSSKHNHMKVHGIYCETSTLDEPAEPPRI